MMNHSVIHVGPDLQQAVAVTLQKHPGSAHVVFPQAIEWLMHVTGNKEF